MNRDSPAALWDFFDNIYCISLKERADRRREALVQFEKVGLADRIEFFLVDKHATDCEEGIYQSHTACLKKGLQTGAERIVIFEDDIRFERFHPDKLKDCIDFISLNADWNMFFFGCLVSGSQKTGNRSVLKVKYRCMAHSYVIHRRFAEAVTATPWRRLAFDDMLRSRQQHFYAAYPSFAFQSNSATDNNNCLRLDKFRRLIGGLGKIQKRNEWYHRYKWAVIATHILVVLLITMWMM
ncbi:MAG: glycosyltransferase family 25 protein [Thermodesulfobacteriota bacterium]